MKLNSELRETYSRFFMANSNSLQKIMYLYLKHYYGKENIENEHEYYLFVKGTIPIILIAHFDTVFRYPPSENEIFYDEYKNVMWSPRGLGADDRAGILAILELVKRGFRPYILLTQEEESGGIVAIEFLKYHSEAPKDIHFLIELDRSNRKDCVFYECDNQDFINFISSFGFSKTEGIFTDISLLCPVWGIAGVNLSVGYFFEHSYSEFLNYDFLFETIEKVGNILSSKTKRYKYIEKKNIKPILNEITCSKCKELHNIANVHLVEKENGEDDIWCISCLIKSKQEFYYCKKCGKPILKNQNSVQKAICNECSKEEKYIKG